MMGDRERCIQAQMDEYLSKPLQQNHLIQTILKCATLGGALLEKNRERELRRQAEEKSLQHSHGSGHAHGHGPGLLRPSLEGRSATTNEPIMGNDIESPAIVTTNSEDPIHRARSTLSEPSV